MDASNIFKKFPLALLIAMPSLAFGGPIAFDFGGICLDVSSEDGERALQCENIGLDHGDIVLGSIEADSDALSDLVLTGEEIRDTGAFSFVFGNTLFNSSNAWVGGFAVLDSGLNIVGGWFNMNNLFTAANTLTFTPTGGGVWSVRRFGNYAGGIGRYTTRVSEPESLGLLGLGLLALGFVSWRRRAR